MCDTHAESIGHLFFECSYARYIWALCRLKLGLSLQISDLHNEAKMIKSTFSSKSKTTALARLAFPAAVWHVLKERNMRIFNKSSLSKLHRFQKLNQGVLILLQSCNWDNDTDSTKLLLNWCSPVSG